MVAYPAYDGSEPCRQVDPEIYYPSSFYAVTRMTRALMDSLCNDCHARDACLLWALHHEKDGYWAGTTPEDRYRLRRSMNILLDVPTIPITERRQVA